MSIYSTTLNYAKQQPLKNIRPKSDNSFAENNCRTANSFATAYAPEDDHHWYYGIPCHRGNICYLSLYSMQPIVAYCKTCKPWLSLKFSPQIHILVLKIQTTKRCEDSRIQQFYLSMICLIPTQIYCSSDASTTVSKA